MKQPLFVICILLSGWVFAQNEKKNWYFGTGTDGIVFDGNNNPVKVNNKFPGLGTEGNVTVSDPYTGELLFYTDGIRVINKNHSVMTNGSGLNANLSCSQGCQVTKMPGTCNKYYVISNSSWDDIPGSLYYSIVDFSNNPLGEVTVKNQYLDGVNYHQALKVVPKKNSNNYWLIGHQYNTATYKVFEMSNNGFSAPQTYSFANSGRSWALEFNAQTNRLICLGEDDILVSSFNFNTTTGVISNEQQLALNTFTYSGVGNFSPDGSKFYALIEPGGFKLWQYDFNTSVWTDMNTCCYAHDVETGPNGITYHIHTYYGANPLAQMTNANASAIGNACGYSIITNPGNFNGELRRFPDFLIIPDRPVANIDVMTIASLATVSIPVLNNDYDPQGDVIYIDSLTILPKRGTAIITGNSIRYVNTSGGCGVTDTFAYLIRDTTCMYDTALVIIYINGASQIVPFTFQTNCTSTSVAFNNPNPSSIYRWNFGDSTPEVTTQNPTHIFPAAGTFVVTLIVTNACGSDTASQQITITNIPAPVALFTIDTNACSPLVTFNSFSSNNTSQQWLFGDGNSSNTQSPVHTYSASGNYTVTLIATNSCGSDTNSTTLNLLPFTNPNASFVIPSNTCGLNVSSTNSSTESVTYSWNFGDGSPLDTAQKPTHIFLSSGTYAVTLIVYNACGSDTASQQVSVTSVSPAVASFKVDTTSCSPLVTFNNLSLDYTSQQWFFGDGDSSTSQNPIHTYASAGSYTAILRVSNSCNSDTFISTVNLRPFFQPNADFSIDTNFCSLSISLVNQSTDALTFVWNFGDGNSSSFKNPQHTYLTEDSFNIQLITSNDCGLDSISKLFVLRLPDGIADFKIGVNSCSQEIAIENSSKNAITHFWNFGDNITDSSISPKHIYSDGGIYKVQLIINKGTLCEDELTKAITLSEEQGAIFIPNIFSPNEDNSNDVYEVLGFGDCSPYELKIFNRWGEIVFKSTDRKIGWDGFYRGKPQPAGVYVYMLYAIGKKYKGSITLIR